MASLQFADAPVSRRFFQPALLKIEQIDNAKERKRKAGRKEKAEEAGTNFAATTLERLTVRTLKFVRWLRNFIYRATSWEPARARLRHIYATISDGVFHTVEIRNQSIEGQTNNILTAVDR